ncbi:LysR family transcriptional regulator [Shewanella maritima]|uniref:LysR family transcriptional regulator n=1 Tax=Shewanella maritima TaxID=2520507 RepID=A0A411PLQ7_9GAMM|nr:LysR substrate-binding domain-containing protein [Shewanella maritima]QBF84463.1 LysR family transcriptional regulator [Shewanella maritima]
MLNRSEDLTILIAVAEHGGFSAAANALDIQVAKVSRSVSRIESTLGVSLINRTTRKIELTEEGKQFIHSVRQALNQVDLAEQAVINLGHKPAGKLRVDAATPFVLHQLVPLVAEFRQAYPDIELQLTSNEGYVDLIENRTDLAIRIGRLHDSSMHASSLGKSKLHLVAAPDYLEKYGNLNDVAELSQHQLIGFSDIKQLNIWPLPGFESAVQAGQMQLSCSNGETMRQLVLAGNGIACLSNFMVANDIASGKLVSVLADKLIANSDRENVSAVYYRSSAVSSRISAFIEFIKPRLAL